ncbi:MAG: hypothetical protein ACI8TX_002171 [Hyphomicrobiaceae bacterium]|jgi:hypothetical protein
MRHPLVGIHTLILVFAFSAVTATSTFAQPAAPAETAKAPDPEGDPEGDTEGDTDADHRSPLVKALKELRSSIRLKTE